SGTPPDIVAKLYTELKTAFALPEIHETISRSGMIPQDSPPPEELQRYVASEAARWGTIVQKAGAAGIEKLVRAPICAGRRVGNNIGAWAAISPAIGSMSILLLPPATRLPAGRASPAPARCGGPG